MQRLDWGRAKLEVLAVRQYILNLHREGNTISEIHRKLVGGGKITAKKSAFYSHVAPIIAEAANLSLQDNFPVLLSPQTMAPVKGVPEAHRAAPVASLPSDKSKSLSSASSNGGGLIAVQDGKVHSIRQAGFIHDRNADSRTRSKKWNAED